MFTRIFWFIGGTSMKESKTHKKSHESHESHEKHAHKHNSSHSSPKKMKIKKSWLQIVGAAVLLLVIVAIVMTLASVVLESNNDNAAIVMFGDEKLMVLNSDVDFVVEQLLQNSPDVVREDVVRQLAEVEIVKAEAKNIGISIDRSEVESIINQQLDLLKGQISSEDLQARLDEQGLSYDQFIERLYSSLETDMTIQELFKREVVDKIEVIESELQTLYDLNAQGFQVPQTASVKHILVCYAGASRCEDTRTQEEALALVQSVLADTTVENFSEMAGLYSDGPSGPNGGDIGQLRPGDTVKPFNDAAFGADVDTVVGPVETEFGYHLIVTYAKAEAGTLSFEDARATIEEQYLLEKSQIAQKEYVENLVAQAEITIVDAMN
jgi:parvulin-like peptidyl-prolyl isomerase